MSSISTSTLISVIVIELIKPYMTPEKKLIDDDAVILVTNATAIARAMLAIGLSFETDDKKSH